MVKDDVDAKHLRPLTSDSTTSVFIDQIKLGLK